MQLLLALLLPAVALGAVEQVTDQATFKRILAESPAVVVDFFSQSCGPCIMIAPKYKELAKEYEGRVRFLKVDVQQHNVGVQVRSMPTFHFYFQGKLDHQFSGADENGMRQQTQQLDRKAEAADVEVSLGALEAFYKEHDPSKLDNVDEIYEKYPAYKLVAILKKKYGKAPEFTKKNSRKQAPKAEGGGKGEAGGDKPVDIRKMDMDDLKAEVRHHRPHGAAATTQRRRRLQHPRRPPPHPPPPPPPARQVYRREMASQEKEEELVLKKNERRREKLGLTSGGRARSQLAPARQRQSWPPAARPPCAPLAQGAPPGSRAELRSRGTGPLHCSHGARGTHSSAGVTSPPPHLTSPLLTSPHPTPPRLASPHLASPPTTRQRGRHLVGGPGACGHPGRRACGHDRRHLQRARRAQAGGDRARHGRSAHGQGRRRGELPGHHGGQRRRHHQADEESGCQVQCHLRARAR